VPAHHRAEPVTWLIRVRTSHDAQGVGASSWPGWTLVRTARVLWSARLSSIGRDPLIGAGAVDEEDPGGSEKESLTAGGIAQALAWKMAMSSILRCWSRAWNRDTASCAVVTSASAATGAGGRASRSRSAGLSEARN